MQLAESMYLHPAHIVHFSQQPQQNLVLMISIIYYMQKSSNQPILKNHFLNVNNQKAQKQMLSALSE